MGVSRVSGSLTYLDESRIDFREAIGSPVLEAPACYIASSG